MKVLGLTGGIATGKSTVAKYLRQKNIPVFDADAAAHEMLKEGGPVFDSIVNLFPNAVRERKIDRKLLGSIVFADDDALKKLEKLIHPEVRKAEEAFLRRMKKEGLRLIVLDIPLLFESGAEALCDAVMVTDCEEATQRARVFGRPNMTEEKWLHIMRRQMPRQERLARADYVISTGIPLKETFAAVDEVIGKMETANA